MTDAREHWAVPWIQSVVRAGVLEIYPNHTFEPESPIRRGDLAQAVSRLLDLVAIVRPVAARQWQGAAAAMADVAPSHLSYPAVSVAVSSGVMKLLDGCAFGLARPVSGAEAAEAIDRIAQIAGPQAALR